MLHAMIMAGGGGTRFWPRSRDARPKQFLSFAGDRTLLQSTLDRIAPIVPPDRSWVITGDRYVAETAKQLPELSANNIVGEPFRRDTAPCIALGAALIAKSDPDATMIVMPADHLIEPEREFQRAVLAAAEFADEFPEALFTFGIRPTFPSDGYGYIHRGPVAAQRNGIDLHRVLAFKEKPTPDVAEQFLHDGDKDWNSGIFVWKVRTILAQLKERRPDIHDACVRVADAWDTPHRVATFTKEYEAIKGTSIDFAVMEHAPVRMMLRAPYQWDDVGSWLALERRNAQDANGNTLVGKTVCIDTVNSVVVADDGRVIATIGVSDLLIIQDGNATLVANRKEEVTVKKVVDQLRANGWKEFL